MIHGGKRDRPPTHTGPSPERVAPPRTRRAVPPAIVLAVSAGGIGGTWLRYALSRAIHVAPGSFPWATFSINVSGSLVLGVVVTLIIERWPPTRYVRPFAAIGFLGAYTTFSTYVVEADLLVKDGHAPLASAYVVASLLGGLVAAFTGIVIARLRPPGREHR